MSVDHGLLAWVEECLEPLGRVTARPMMGGATLYLDGTVFAILALDDLWFKADKVSDAEWDAAGAERFTYDAAGRTATMNYRRAPAMCTTTLTRCAAGRASRSRRASARRRRSRSPDQGRSAGFR